MNRQPRLIRILGTAGVGVFLVASVAFGADAIGQAPSRAIDPSLTTSDQTAAPALNQLAEPTETAEPAETAEPTETPEPAETRAPAATATAAPTPDHELGDDQGDDDQAGDDRDGATLEAEHTALTGAPTASPDDHGDGSGTDDGGSDDSGHDGGGHS